MNDKNKIEMIYVFTTSVKTKKAVQQLQPFLNNLLPESRWNFDLKDCGNILRIDTCFSTVALETVIGLLKSKGFDCEELTG